MLLGEAPLWLLTSGSGLPEAGLLPAGKRLSYEIGEGTTGAGIVTPGLLSGPAATVESCATGGGSGGARRLAENACKASVDFIDDRRDEVDFMESRRALNTDGDGACELPGSAATTTASATVTLDASRMLPHTLDGADITEFYFKS